MSERSLTRETPSGAGSSSLLSESANMSPSLAELRTIVHAAVLTPSPIRAYRPERGRQERFGGVVLHATGGAAPEFNIVFVLGAEAPERVFAMAETFSGPAVRFSVTVEVESATSVEATLRAGGWRLDEEEPALALALIPAAPPAPPAELQIQLVRDAPTFEAFRAHDRTSAQHVPSLAAALDPAIAFLTGSVDGQVVASARLTCLGSVAEITGVSTAPAYRRRGYGAALTWAAIAEGRARGCVAATLTASEMGLPLYLKMGFTRVCTFRTYLPPE